MLHFNPVRLSFLRDAPMRATAALSPTSLSAVHHASAQQQQHRRPSAASAVISLPPRRRLGGTTASQHRRPSDATTLAHRCVIHTTTAIQLSLSARSVAVGAADRPPLTTSLVEDDDEGCAAPSPVADVTAPSSTRTLDTSSPAPLALTHSDPVGHRGVTTKPIPPVIQGDVGPSSPLWLAPNDDDDDGLKEASVTTTSSPPHVWGRCPSLRLPNEWTAVLESARRGNWLDSRQWVVRCVGLGPLYGLRSSATQSPGRNSNINEGVSSSVSTKKGIATRLPIEPLLQTVTFVPSSTTSPQSTSPNGDNNANIDGATHQPYLVPVNLLDKPTRARLLRCCPFRGDVDNDDDGDDMSRLGVASVEPTATQATGTAIAPTPPTRNGRKDDEATMNKEGTPLPLEGDDLPDGFTPPAEFDALSESAAPQQAVGTTSLARADGGSGNNAISTSAPDDLPDGFTPPPDFEATATGTTESVANARMQCPPAPILACTGRHEAAEARAWILTTTTRTSADGNATKGPPKLRWRRLDSDVGLLLVQLWTATHPALVAPNRPLLFVPSVSRQPEPGELMDGWCDSAMFDDMQYVGSDWVNRMLRAVVVAIDGAPTDRINGDAEMAPMATADDVAAIAATSAAAAAPRPNDKTATTSLTAAAAAPTWTLQVANAQALPNPFAVDGAVRHRALVVDAMPSLEIMLLKHLSSVKSTLVATSAAANTATPPPQPTTSTSDDASQATTADAAVEGPTASVERQPPGGAAGTAHTEQLLPIVTQWLHDSHRNPVLSMVLSQPHDQSLLTTFCMQHHRCASYWLPVDLLQRTMEATVATAGALSRREVTVEGSGSAAHQPSPPKAPPLPPQKSDNLAATQSSSATNNNHHRSKKVTLSDEIRRGLRTYITTLPLAARFEVKRVSAVCVCDLPARAYESVMGKIPPWVATAALTRPFLRYNGTWRKVDYVPDDAQTKSEFAAVKNFCRHRVTALRLGNNGMTAASVGPVTGGASPHQDEALLAAEAVGGAPIEASAIATPAVPMLLLWSEDFTVVNCRKYASRNRGGGSGPRVLSEEIANVPIVDTVRFANVEDVPRAVADVLSAHSFESRSAP